MDNIITGAIAVAMFLAFAGGLAESIGAIPFILIVVIVAAMLCTDFYQSAKQGLEEERRKKSGPSA
ncbi:MAG: hypothetical protein JSU67_18600 [Gammaproteobacteria bacterium]|nr:MAG: hypothetical protein EP300_13750 [Gammaproteobacteria bacterium]UCH40105.1 MAG: hypothetical protein JSU67_18600 [Gammaproteobacteria bacterium]